MDVYLTSDADRSLRAIALIAAASVHGYLIGHRRGPRYYVESVVPSVGSRGFSYTDVQRLDRIFGGRTIGFFVIGGSAKARSLGAGPFACGRLVLEAKRGPGPGLRFKAFAVDYERGFVLSPVPVTRSPERKKS